MVLIKLQLDGNETIDEVDDYSQGHITIEGKNGIISSKRSSINQSMMIFVAAIELLDGYRIFINNKHEGIYNFVGCDSSFTFYLIRQSKESKIIVENSDEEIIDELEQLELAKCILESSKVFFNTYVKPKDNWEFAKNDLANAMKDFAGYFGLD